MDFITIAFHAISCLLALLASALLLFVNQERKHSSRLLACLLIIFALQNLVFLLLFTRLMLSVPWFLRIVAPTTFLVGPITFLYFRSVLTDETSFKRSDWLFLIPAILTIVNFMPYYLLPAQEKIDLVNRSFYGKRQAQDPGTGLLPGSIYYIVRILWSGVFVYLTYRLLQKFKEQATADFRDRNKILLKWLTTFLVLLTAMWVSTILRLVIPTLKNSYVGPADLMLGATILYTCFQLFLRPHILYGVFQPLSASLQELVGELGPPGETDPGSLDIESMVKVPVVQTSVLAGRPVDIAEQLRFKKLVEANFQERLVFLQHDYTLDHLVKDTRIPRYALSAFINREYGMGFREFLNRRRLEYMTVNFNCPKWQNYTLEAKAMESGFANRITFFKNLKQFTGKTPKEYFRADIRPDATTGI